MNKRLIVLILILIALIAVLVVYVVTSGAEVKPKDSIEKSGLGINLPDVKDTKAEEKKYTFSEGDCLQGLKASTANLSGTQYAFGQVYLSEPEGYSLFSASPLTFSKGNSKISVQALKYSKITDLIKDTTSEYGFDAVTYLQIGDTYQFCSTKDNKKYLFYSYPFSGQYITIQYSANTSDFENDLFGYYVIKDSIKVYS
ncbi:MAG: hypothetical protein PHH82_00165 [Candidatus ainarchaeum sp.]|nr:hypothetical protein [Candidatus ainarchaeum sp.]